MLPLYKANAHQHLKCVAIISYAVNTLERILPFIFPVCYRSVIPALLQVTSVGAFALAAQISAKQSGVVVSVSSPVTNSSMNLTKSLHLSVSHLQAGKWNLTNGRLLFIIVLFIFSKQCVLPWLNYKLEFICLKAVIIDPKIGCDLHSLL